MSREFLEGNQSKNFPLDSIEHPEEIRDLESVVVAEIERTGVEHVSHIEIDDLSMTALAYKTIEIGLAAACIHENGDEFRATVDLLFYGDAPGRYKLYPIDVNPKSTTRKYNIDYGTNRAIFTVYRRHVSEIAATN